MRKYCLRKTSGGNRRWFLTRQPGMRMPYCGAPLRYLDQLISWLLFRPAYWDSPSGHLCYIMPKGHGVEVSSHFPGWMWQLSVNFYNRFPKAWGRS